MREKANEIATHEGHLGEQIPQPFGRELSELTATFNEMSVKLRHDRDHLEELVNNRTEALKESEQRYHSLFENMLDGFAYCRMLFEDGKPQDFIYLAVNDAFESQTGLKDVVGRKATEVIPGIRESDLPLLEIYGRVAMTGRPERFEMFVEALQMWFWVSVYSPAHEHFVAVFDVITERKQAKEKIKASLLEKETMLKEIHHRVKNNLQLISSLLELQSSYVQDKKSREIFQESQDRISTMAKIHTMLCQSEDMSGVDFGGFIGDLAGRLHQSYGIAVSRVGIHVNVDVSLTIETSIPCGLILNELVSNALKHAFPEGRGGKVNISMIKAGDRFVLTVQDNGIGFPEALDFQNAKSLGLELVNLLVGQMNGAITLTVEGGTTFIITFPAVSKGG
jgi:PAS domain S-box-containing protein